MFPATLATGRAVLLFFALGALLVGAPLWGGARFFYRDVTRQYAPVSSQVSRALSEGHLPTWNASTQAGVPLLANPHAAALSPHTLLFRLLPFHLAYAWTVALALGLLGWGLQRLLEPRVGVKAALVGSVVFMASGVALSATSYLPMLVAIACVPHVAVALLRSTRVLSLEAVAWLTVQLLSGDPALIPVSLLLVVVLEVSRPLLLRTVVSLSVAAALAAFQLLPAWSLLSDSARSTADVSQRLLWSFHPARMFEWVVRLPFGALLAPPYFDRYALAAGADAQPFLLDHGWGVVCVALLVPALSSRGPLRRAGLLLLLTGMVLSMGKHLPGGDWLWRVPPLSFLRFPERFGVVVALGAAVLAAHGMAAVGSLRRPVRAGGVGLGAAVLISSALLDAPMAHAALISGVLLLLAGAALALPRGALLALLLVGVVDWARARQADRLVLEGLTDEVPAAATRLGAGRVWRDNLAFRSQEVPPRGPDGFLAEVQQSRRTLASALPGQFGVDELGGYSPVSLRWWQPVVRTFAQTPDVLFRMFDVCHVVTARGRGWKSRFGFEQELDLGDGAFLLRYRGCAGRAWRVASLVPAANHDEALARLGAPDFDPVLTAVVEGAAEPVGGLEAGPVELAPRSNPAVVELTVPSSSRPQLVVVAESWAPGWSVTLDGLTAPVLRVDGTLLGVAVPPATRRVRFHYEEPWLLAGASLSLLGVVVVLAEWVRRRASSSSSGGHT